MENQLDAETFLQAFNITGSRLPLLTIRDLIELELRILRRLKYHIPSHEILTKYDPITVVTYYSSVYTFLNKTSMELKQQLLQQLIEYDTSLVQRNPNATALSRLRLSCMTMAIYGADNTDLRNKVRSCIQDVNSSPAWDTMDTTTRQLAISLLVSAVHLYARQRRTGLDILDQTLKRYARKGVNLMNVDPIAVVLYYPSVTDWLQRTRAELKKELILRMIEFDSQVTQTNNTPATIISRLRLLAMTLAVFGQQAPIIAKALEKLNEISNSSHWRHLDSDLKPVAQRLIRSVMELARNQRDEGLQMLNSCLYDLRSVDLLTCSCYSYTPR